MQYKNIDPPPVEWPINEILLKSALFLITSFKFSDRSLSCK